MGTERRRLKYFCWFRKLKFDILFIQETHCFDKETAEKWSQDWGPSKNSIWTTGSSNSKGVAVLFKPNSDYKISNKKIDLNGRYIYFEIKLEDENFKFINIYAPNDPRERVLFFLKINSWVEVNNTKHLVGGDYNCTLNNMIDRLNCTSEYDEGRDELKEIMNKKFLLDIYRKRNPNTKCFSFSRGNKQSRLDYWLIDKSLDSNVDEIKYQACPFSDHSMAVLKLDLSKIKLGPGNWKMNSSVIKSDLFKACFTDMWRNWQEEKPNFDLHTWWDLGKKKIKQLTVWCAQKLKSQKDAFLKELQVRLDSEMHKLNKDNEKISFLEASIDKIINEQCEGDKIRSRAKWVEEGEGPSAYFHNLEKYHAQKKNWTKILDENNQLVYGTDNIMKVQTDFYQKLFSTEGSNPERREFFGNFIDNPIGAEDFAILNKKVDLDDIKSALKKVKRDSSPGPDGLIFQFYEIYFDILKDDLLQVYSTSYEQNELTYSQYLALIILLYKKNTREDIKNWRPISLSNTDLKILTKIFAERLKHVLPQIIHKNQCGCVKGRRIGQGIRTISDILNEMGDDNVILMDDKEKAFDRVEWPWLFHVLKKFGLGTYFINWIQIIYKNMKSAIVTNGYISPYFNISRGIRQGDPLSALLYVLQAEPLSECLRCSPRIKGITFKDSNGVDNVIKGSSYVDDSNHMLQNIDSVHNCLEIIDDFGEASGSKVNKSKSIAFVNENFTDYDTLENIINVCRGTEIVLGVPIGRGRGIDIFWDEKYKKMEQKIILWKARHLTIFGKVHISKSLVLPLIQYAASHIDISDSFIENVQKLIWSFIWKWGTKFVANEICYLPRISGGINVPNVSNMIKASRIKMLINVFKGEGIWTVLPKKYFCCLDKLYDIEYFALLVTDSTNELEKCNIPEFYKMCLLALQELNRYALFRSKNEIIWCNSNFTFKNKVLDYKHWSKAGFKRVNDILSNYEIDRELIVNRLTNKAGFFFEFIKTVKSIPVESINECKSDDVLSFEQYCYRVPGLKSPKNLFDLDSKDIYSILCHGQVKQNKSIGYWNAKFDFEINFDLLFKNLFVCKIIPRKALDFNWRIFNFSVNFEKYLVKMGYSDGCCICCTGPNADAFHLFIDCQFFLDTRSTVIEMLDTIGFSRCEPFNWIFGYMSTNESNDVANLILSSFRWSVWKKNCDVKNKNKGWELCAKIQFLNYLYNHLSVLLKSKKMRLKESVFKKCEHIRMMCENSLPFRC